MTDMTDKNFDPVQSSKRASSVPDESTQAGSNLQLSASLPMLSASDQGAGGAVPVITFQNVTKIYDAQPDHTALNNISLQIFAGEFVFLVGHSGSGKSTFIRLITRELVPTQGKLVIANEDLSKLKDWRVPYLRRNLG